jgi:hypothetical protein
MSNISISMHIKSCATALLCFPKKPYSPAGFEPGSSTPVVVNNILIVFGFQTEIVAAELKRQVRTFKFMHICMYAGPRYSVMATRQKCGPQVGFSPTVLHPGTDVTIF